MAIVDPAENAYRGVLGSLLATVAVAVGVIALGFAGVESPSWWTDQFALPRRLGPLVLFMLAWAVMVGAATVAGDWATRVGARLGAPVVPISIVAELAGVAVAVAFFLGLSLAGDSWGVLAAWIFIGVLVIIVGLILIDRLKRRS